MRGIQGFYQNNYQVLVLVVPKRLHVQARLLLRKEITVDLNCRINCERATIIKDAMTAVLLTLRERMAFFSVDLVRK